jgi:epoxyqueuosine reductase
MPVLNREARFLEEKIKARALSLGFCSCGITTPEPAESFPRYQQWLDKKQHGDMKYLSSPYHQESRRDVHSLMPDVQSILCLGYSYPLHPVSSLNQRDKGLVAGYAAGRDYHLTLPLLMDSLITFIRSISGVNIHALRFTDSAPILERELAQRAGLGWIGKNSCLISPEFGSTILLAEILIDLPLAPDPPFLEDRCGTCHRCLDACPTACINLDRTLNASRCISYHTIENKNDIPAEIAEKISPWLFGCDVCQMVCPWNHKVQKNKSKSPALSLSIPELIQTLSYSLEDFEKRFDQSPLLRARWNGFLRNAIIVLASSVSEVALPALHEFLQSKPGEDLLSTTRWSIDQLMKNPPG